MTEVEIYLTWEVAPDIRIYHDSPPVLFSGRGRVWLLSKKGVYGTRGSNGVIVVTTKKGSKDGQVHTSYSGQVSMDTGFSQQHTLSMSGGNDRSNYRVSVDYRNAHGIDLRSGREDKLMNIGIIGS